MDLNKLIRREKKIIDELNNCKTENLKELLEIATFWGRYYSK